MGVQYLNRNHLPDHGQNLDLCFALPGDRNCLRDQILPTWRPDPYQDWTFTSKQTMTFQDTPRDVGQRILYYSLSAKAKIISLGFHLPLD
jgi:hypothetical protein